MEWGMEKGLVGRCWGVSFLGVCFARCKCFLRWLGIRGMLTLVVIGLFMELLVLRA